jgi:hypothetical protein
MDKWYEMNSKLLSPAAKSAPASMYNPYEDVKPLVDAVWPCSRRDGSGNGHREGSKRQKGRDGKQRVSRLVIPVQQQNQRDEEGPDCGADFIQRRVDSGQFPAKAIAGTANKLMA